MSANGTPTAPNGTPTEPNPVQAAPVTASAPGPATAAVPTAPPAAAAAPAAAPSDAPNAATSTPTPSAAPAASASTPTAAPNPTATAPNPNPTTEANAKTEPEPEPSTTAGPSDEAAANAAANAAAAAANAAAAAGPDMSHLFAARREEEMARRDRSLAEFLVMLDGYKPLIPEEVTEYYLQRAGFECSDPRLKRLLSLSAQKFISDLSRDALHFAKLRVNGTTAGRGRPAAGVDRNRVVLTMDDLSLALGDHGVNVKKPDYFL